MSKKITLPEVSKGILNFAFFLLTTGTNMPKTPPEIIELGEGISGVEPKDALTLALMIKKVKSEKIQEQIEALEKCLERLEETQ